ncbi:MAG: SAM-dependent methyltransferase, partial [Pseudomonadota bacterium]
MRHRSRAARQPAFFLHEEAADEIKERLAEVNKSFTSPALIGHISPALGKIVPNCIATEDSPELSLARAAHDLVIHSFGLHWADDPVGQLVQSRLALQPDGLFLGVMFGG